VVLVRSRCACPQHASATRPLKNASGTPAHAAPAPSRGLGHPDWLFEVKHDGFRALAQINGHHCDLVSRNGHTFKHWPQLCEELAHAVKAHDAVIDGEIVCLDARGRSNFKSLLFRREWQYFYAFDLLAVDGEGPREWPLVERKRRLRRLSPSVPTRLLYVDHVQARGRDFSRSRVRTTSRASWPSWRAVATMRRHEQQLVQRSRIPRTHRWPLATNCSSAELARTRAVRCCVFRSRSASPGLPNSLAVMQ
jgi:hypothetical protein